MSFYCSYSVYVGFMFTAISDMTDILDMTSSKFALYKVQGEARFFDNLEKFLQMRQMMSHVTCILTLMFHMVV